jgi:hypothetical protein
MNEPDDWHGVWIGYLATPCLWTTYLKPSGIREEGRHRFSAEAVAPGFKVRFDFESQLVDFAGQEDQTLPWKVAAKIGDMFEWLGRE